MMTKTMNVAIIGLGSMGKRRLRILQNLNQGLAIFGVDGRSDRREEVLELYNIKAYESIEALVAAHTITAALVCTAPIAHAEIITKLLQLNLHVFTEINLVATDYEKNIELAHKNNKILFLSSTFLYREEIMFIKDRVQKEQSLKNYHYHVGQYLPDWHPWENYKDFFVNDRRTNGCREIFAIELPWLVDTFGPIVSVQSVKGNMSTLDLDYPDNYQVILKHASGAAGALNVDIVSRKAVRHLEVYGEACYVAWDGTPEGIQEYDFNEKKDVTIQLYDHIEHDDKYSSFIVENAYINEVKSFLQAIDEGVNHHYGFKEDLEVLRWIDEIENET